MTSMPRGGRAAAPLWAFALLLAFAFASAGCGASSEDDALEYRNDEVSYADGESCMERYLLYEDDGRYERYMAGMYFGNEVPGLYFGTLFETGTYAAGAGPEEGVRKIAFYPKKQYDFDTKTLEYLGLPRQRPYYGTLTDTELTIPWQDWLDYLLDRWEVSVTYTRK